MYNYGIFFLDTSRVKFVKAYANHITQMIKKPLKLLASFRD